MCPPTPSPVPQLAELGLYWTDEEICMCLYNLECGSPVPLNITEDINPFQYRPSVLPDGIWYLICSEDKKYSEHGFWRAQGEACEIFSNSIIIGERTTLEFHEGEAPHGRRTDWAMQEYRVTQKELSHNTKQKDPKSLCRVFRVDGESPNKEMNSKVGGATTDGGNHSHPMPAAISKSDSGSRRGSTDENQVKSQEIELLAPVLGLPVDNVDELDRNYVELDDLADLISPSFNSDNSSCLSMTSEEYFDPSALLQVLEDEKKQESQGSGSNFQLRVSASVRSNEVFILPATSGTLISGNASQLPEKMKKSGLFSEEKILNRRDPQPATKMQKVNDANVGTSHCGNVSASSNGTKSEGQAKPVVSIIKELKKKYLCCIPF